MKIKAWAAKGPNQKLEPFEYDPGPLNADDVEVTVENSGLCHSDVSVINNEWGFTKYPVVPGHEVIGRVSALGSRPKGWKSAKGLASAGRPARACIASGASAATQTSVRRVCQQSSAITAASPNAWARVGHSDSRGSRCDRRRTAFVRRGHRIHAAQSFRSQVDRQSRCSRHRRPRTPVGEIR